MVATGKLIRVARVNSEASEQPSAHEPGELVRGLNAGEPWAERALVQAETSHVQRMLTRILGFRAELDDLTR